MTKRRSVAGDHLPTEREKTGTVKKVVDESLETRAYQLETLKWQEAQLAKLKVTNASLQEVVAWRESQIKALNKSEDYLKAEIAQLERAIASNGEALAWRAEQVAELEQALVSQGEALTWLGKELGAQVEQLQRDLDYLQGKHDATSDQLRDVSSQLEDTLGSTGWKFVLWVRQIRDRVLPAGTRRRNGYQKLMTRVRSRLGR